LRVAATHFRTKTPLLLPAHELGVMSLKENKMYRTTTIILTVLISSCSANLSKEAGEVQLHSQISAILDDCEKLGPVRVMAKSLWSTNKARAQAKADLRQAAYDKYKADTVVLVNTDEEKIYFTHDKSYANGIAFNCFK